MKELGTFKPTEEVSIEQELDTAQRELVSEVYGRVANFAEGDAEVHERARVARKIILLQDPYQDQVTLNADGTVTYENVGNKPTMQLQTLKSTYNNTVADQMDNMPEPVMLPERPELQEMAEELTDTVRWVMDNNDYEHLHRRRVEDYLCTGTSVIQIAWDEDMNYGKGDIALIRYPIECVLFDPLVENLQDSRAVIKVSWHPLSWYTAHYPDHAKYIGGENGLHNGVGVLMAQESDMENDEPRAMLVEYWYRKYNAKTRRYSINVAHVAGGALLAVKEDVYLHGRYPFAIDVHTPIEGWCVGEGMVMELAPMMRYINRYAAYIDMNLRMSSKGRLLIRKDSGIKKEDIADWSKDIIEGDKIDPENLQWLQHVPFTGMAAQAMLQMQTDLKQDSGQNQFTRGETAGGVVAFSAINALQEAGNKQNRMKTASLNVGFKEMVEQIMWLVYQFYDDDRKLIIVGEKGTENKVVDASSKHLFGRQKGKGAYSAPPYSVRVQIQRRNPLQVQAQNELFIQAYTMAAQAQQVFPLSVLFRLLTVDGKEKIMPILEQNDVIQQQMMQLAQQNEQLAQRNQQLEQGVQQLSQVNAKMGQMAKGKMYSGGEIQPPEGANQQMAL